jgi:hypothetical protein
LALALISPGFEEPNLWRGGYIGILPAMALPGRLFLVFCVLIASFGGAARAASSNTPSETQFLREPFRESKSLTESVLTGAPVTGTFVGTPGTPFGDVSLTAVLENGRKSGEINVTFYAYSAGVGIYTVSAITESSSSTVVLGTVTVASMTPTITNNGGETMETPGGIGNATFGGTGSRLPTGLNPFDIASVSISDSNGKIITTGILTPVQVGTYNANSRLSAGRASPFARGFASIYDNTNVMLSYMSAGTSVMPITGIVAVPATSGSASVSGSTILIITGPPMIVSGPAHPPYGGNLVIHAHGLRRNAQLTYALDGTDIGTVTTDAGGNLALSVWQDSYGNTGPIPGTVNLFSVKKVTVHDGAGRVCFAASF